MKNVLSTLVAVTVLASTAMSADRRAPVTGGGNKGISDSSAASLAGLSTAVEGSLKGSSEFVSALGGLVSAGLDASGQSVASAATHSVNAVIASVEFSGDASKAIITLVSEVGTFSVEVSTAAYNVSKQVYDSVEDSAKASSKASEDSLKASWQVGKNVVVTIIDVAGIVSAATLNASSQAATFVSNEVIEPSAKASVQGSESVSVALLQVGEAIILAPKRLIDGLVSLRKEQKQAPATRR